MNPSPVATVRTYPRLVAYTAQTRCYPFPGDEKCENASHWVKPKMSAQLHTSADSERESCSFSLLCPRSPVLLGYCPLTLSRSAIHHPIFLGCHLPFSFSCLPFHSWGLCWCHEGRKTNLGEQGQLVSSHSSTWTLCLHVKDQYSITVRTKMLVPLTVIPCLPREFSSCKMSGSRSTGRWKETILKCCQMQSSELWAFIQLISTLKKAISTICQPGLYSLFRWGNWVRSQQCSTK